MPLASIETLGPYIGAYELTTPSGRTVAVTPEEEVEIAKRALLFSIEQDITRGDRLREQAIESMIGAVGNAVGLAVGGWALGKVLGGIGFLGR